MNSNDQASNQEVDKTVDDDNDLDEGAAFDNDPQDETDDARSIGEQNIDTPVCILWTPTDYIQWINTICTNTKIHELQELSGGSILIELLEKVSRKRMQSLPSPSTVGSESMSKLHNIVSMFEFMSTVDIPIDDQYTVKGLSNGEGGRGLCQGLHAN